MKSFKIILSSILVIAEISLSAAEIEIPNPGPSLESNVFNKYISGLEDEAVSKHRSNLEKAFDSRTSMQEYIETCRQGLVELVGTLPEKTALNARTTGRNTGDGWKEENIVYESVPGRYVAALLFLPSNASEKKPVPCVVITCGHADKGSKRVYAEAASYLARNGIAAIVVDPLGQGERIQETDAEGKSLTRGATTEHGLENMGCLLVGKPLFSRILWDNMRAIDYLQERKDIDSSRIGAMGTSGAGVQTLILTAFDKRVCAAVMSSSIAYGFAGTGLDGCGVIPGIGKKGMTLTDLALSIAPRPFMYMNGQKDYVNIADGRKVISIVKRSYALQGFDEDNVRMLEVPSGHDFYVAGKQEGMVRFFCEKFFNRKSVSWSFPGTVTNAKLAAKAFPAEHFNCTESGQVLLEYQDARSLYRENMVHFESKAAARKKFLSSSSEVVREKVCELLGINIPENEIVVNETYSRKYSSYSFTACRIVRDAEPPVPCAVIVPDGASEDSPVSLWLYDGGKNALLSSPAHIKMALETKGPVVIADLRGFGETKEPMFLKGNFKSWNNEYSNFTRSVFLGKTLIGQRVIDVLSLLDFCSTNKNLKKRKVTVTATGDYVPVVVHAAFLDERITEAKLMHGYKSWRFLLYPLQRDVCGLIVPGAVDFYDISDLARKSEGDIKFYD